MITIKDKKLVDMLKQKEEIIGKRVIARYNKAHQKLSDGSRLRLWPVRER